MPKQRQACERCRQHKLKCLRRIEEASEPCVRCLQAQAECVVSLRKQPGRPAGRLKSSSRGNSTCSTPLAAFDDRNPLRASLASSDGSVDPMDSCFDFPLEWTDTTLFPRSLADGYIPDLTDSLHHPYSGLTSSWPSPQETPKKPIWELSHYALDQNFDLGFLVSRLQQKLSEQLIQLRSLSWDITDVLNLEGNCYSAGGSFDPHSCRGGQQDFNPLVSTFEIISEFEKLLYSIRRTMTHGDLPGMLSLPHEIKISHSLTMMSCYLQLVCIYKGIFSYVLDRASSNPAVRDFILNSTPKISLGGFVIPSPKNVLGRSFVQLMQLKIKPIETALGLPDNYCISPKTNTDDVGDEVLQLLGGSQWESLLSALRGTELDGGNSGGMLVAINSLRCMMHKMESFA